MIFNRVLDKACAAKVLDQILFKLEIQKYKLKRTHQDEMRPDCNFLLFYYFMHSSFISPFSLHIELNPHFHFRSSYWDRLEPGGAKLQHGHPRQAPKGSMMLDNKLQ